MDLSNISPELKEQIKSAFTPEQIEKIKECESLDEVFTMLGDEGIELTNEQLELVAGGIDFLPPDALRPSGVLRNVVTAPPTNLPGC